MCKTFMQMKSNENVDPPESPTVNGLRCSDFGANGDSLAVALSEPCDQQKEISLNDSESFYNKLYGLYESSGLNLVVNVRETLLSLHDFYKEVTERGGYFQVSKDERWEEVGAEMKLKGTKANDLSKQLQRAYAHFLYQFEQHYFYRAHHKGNKRKSFVLETIEEEKQDSTTFEAEATKKNNGPNISYTRVSMCDSMEQKQGGPGTPVKAREKKTKSQTFGRQKRIRTAYQIFIKRECERLRGSLGERLIGQSFRSMADDSWRGLSEHDRQPYIDESNKDKEIFSEEMKARKEAENRKLPEGEYRVRSEFEESSGANGQGTVDLQNVESVTENVS